MGDIFRRNSFNLGLHVVQAPDAVADAQDGDEFEFDPDSRALRNVTQGKAYVPVPLTGKEDEIRRSGGIFAVGRREFRKSVETPPAIVWPDAETARTLTTTEQILWAHRVDKDAEVKPGATLRVYADLLPGERRHRAVLDPHVQPDHWRQRDLAAPARDRERPFRVHGRGLGRQADEHRARVREAARHREAVLRDAGRRHLPLLFPEQGLVHPGMMIPGADSHSRRVRRVRRDRHRRRQHDARLRLEHGLHLPTVAKRRRVVFRGKLQPWVTGKDLVLELLRRWGAKQSQGMSVEFVDADQQLPVAYRNTICNMMAEAESFNGIFAPDDITYAWFAAEGA